jgi:hypothetical protein
MDEIESIKSSLSDGKLTADGLEYVESSIIKILNTDGEQEKEGEYKEVQEELELAS